MTDGPRLYRLEDVEDDPLPPGRYVVLASDSSRPPTVLEVREPIPLDALAEAHYVEGVVPS